MTSSSTNDQIYYNIRISPDEGNRTLAQYSVNRVQAILDKPDDYELSIIRFSIPTSTIPLMKITENLYSLSLTVAGNTYTEFLPFIENNLVTPNLRNIFSMQELADSMNFALSTAFTQLAGANVVTSTVPPFFSFDSPTSLLTLNVPKSFETDGIDIFANNFLFVKINTFQTFYNAQPPSQLVYKIIYQDNITNSAVYNGIDYYTMSQDSPTVGSVSDFQSIQFLTSSVPVNPELEGAQTNVTSRVLTDFETFQSGTTTDNILQYFPRGPRRYYTLLSNDPLKRIDLSIRWVNKSGDSFPLYIEGDQSLTVKILFERKQTLRLEEYVTDLYNDLEEMKVNSTK